MSQQKTRFLRNGKCNIMPIEVVYEPGTIHHRVYKTSPFGTSNRDCVTIAGAPPLSAKF